MKATCILFGLILWLQLFLYGDPLLAYEAKLISTSVDLELPYLVLLPDKYDPKNSYPLVAALHPYGEDSFSYAQRVVDLLGYPDFVFLFPQGPWPVQVYPNAPGFAWSTRYYYGLGHTNIGKQILPSFELIEKSINSVKSYYSIDSNNVFLIGEGQGGGHVLQLAGGSGILGSSISGYCSIGFPYANEYQWNRIARTSRKVLVFSEGIDPQSVNIGIHASDAKDSFSISSMRVRAVPLSIPGRIRIEYEELRDWILHHIHQDKLPDITEIVAIISSSKASKSQKCDALRLITYSEETGGYEYFRDALIALMMDDSTDPELLLWAVYTAGALRVKGTEDALLSISSDFDKQYVVSTSVPFLLGSDQSSRLHMGHSRPLKFMLGEDAFEQYMSNNIRLAAINALRKISSEYDIKGFEDNRTAVIAIADYLTPSHASLEPYTGDIIVSVSEIDMKSSEKFISILQNYRPGELMDAKVIRRGKLLDIRLINQAPYYDFRFVEDFVLNAGQASLAGRNELTS